MKRIMRGRRGEGSKAEAMPLAKGYGAAEMQSGSMALEIDGSRPKTELPSQEMRHELI